MPIRGMEDQKEIGKDRLKELAFIDDLTELYNRRYLYQCLPLELKHTKAAGKQLCLFMIDVDGFKKINDTYGHLFGDRILLEIAEILRNSFREGDTVIRYAGDEFIAILPGVEEDVAIKIANRIVEKIGKNPFRESEDKPAVRVTLSVGLALFPRDARSPEKLIYQADRALYSSKRSGRNQICATKDISTQILDERKIQEIFPCSGLIARDDELNRLKDLLDKAEKGETRFALIKGERGIGKTRLLSEFKKHAQQKGITDISVSCSPEIGNQPYQILILALENLFTSLGTGVGEFIKALPAQELIQLANYIPKLKQFLPQDLKVAKTSTGDESQTDLFKGICHCLISAVKRNTTILIVDDFHWIDKATLQLFDHIIKELHNLPLFIVAAYRTEELEKRSDNSSPGELLHQIKQNKLVNELVLTPLKKEDVLTMITTLFAGIQLQAEFVDIVYGTSMGNPLFTEEALRALVNKGLIFYQNGKWLTGEITESTSPPYLKEAIQKRIGELDDETKPVITAAAVMGQAFDFNVLCQLLEKDPGYILELMDRAAKQHLVIPENPFQTDRFKFSSGAIRDIIYNSLDAEKRQDLHRKLALIEEAMYKDNIANVAGSLGYHFGKAHDAEKQSLYANMVLEKAARMPTYEDVFGFLQEALMERVEEILVPLSDVSMKLLPTMVRTLRLAAQNVRLYPAHSAIRQGFIDQAYKSLSDILSKDSTLILGMSESRLLVNGDEISVKASREAGAGAFIVVMVDHRIKSIVFKRNLTKAQLAIFLEGLSQNYDELISEGGLSGMLRRNGISLIKVNEIRYEQTSKLTKQRSKFEEAMLIDYLLGKVSNLQGNKAEIADQIANHPEKLAQALKKVAEAAKGEKGKDKSQAQANIIAQGLQRLSDEVLSQTKGGMEQYRRNITKAMMSLDYNLRSKISQAQAEAAKAPVAKTISKDTTEERSDEEMLEAVTKKLSDSQSDLPEMRSIARNFLLDPRRKEKLLPELKGKLAEMGLNQEESSWVLREQFWQGLSLKDRAQRAIKVTAQDYLKLQPEISENIIKLISELLENDQYSEASEIIDKLVKQLEDKSKEIRNRTVADLDRISEMLILKEKHFLLEQIINSLIVTIDKEKDPQVFSALAQGLAAISVKLIKKKNFIQATGILREFNLHLGSTSKLLDIQKEAIKKAKAETVASTGTINWLIKLLEEKIEGHHDFWELSKIISEIGSAAAGPIFALAISKASFADPFKTYALRWSIARVLKGMQDEAVVYLKDRLADKNVEVVKVALGLLGHMQSKSAITYLRPLLKHENLDVRKEAITTLGKIGDKEAVKLLSESIRDKNSQICLAAIWALVNTESPEVFQLLKPLLKEKKLATEVRRIIQRIEKRQSKGKQK